MPVSVSPYLGVVILLSTAYVHLRIADGEVRTCSYYGRPPKPVAGERWMKTALREAYRRCNGPNYIGVTGCCDGKPLGMKDRSIPDSSITDFRHSSGYPPTSGRLGSNAGWCYGQSAGDPSWIQVDLGGLYSVSGLITAGYASYWVVEYRVACSFDGVNWQDVTVAVDGVATDSPDQLEEPKKFAGNTDGVSHVTTQFRVVVRTRYLRINPTTCYVNFCCFKFEVLGCPDFEI